jgi:hypothetical protein
LARLYGFDRSFGSGGSLGSLTKQFIDEGLAFFFNTPLFAVFSR